MKKAVVIGGRGKVGSYLVPMLVREGYAVTSVSRGKTEPAVKSPEWAQVETLLLDRGGEGFEDAIAAQKADVVVDMICFKSSDMLALTGALSGGVGHFREVEHFLACGSAWMHGPSGAVPVREEECRSPLDEYGRQKDAMDREIQRLWAEDGFPGTMVHPGHIVCAGDVPVGPQGFKSLGSFEALRDGKELWLPNFGMETLHHVHAEDVAGVFIAAIRAGKPAFGQGFHAVSPRAVTMRGYAEEAASWFGREAKLQFEPFEQWGKRFTPQEVAMASDHMLHSPSCSMEKAEKVLGFTPAHSSYSAIRECLESFDL
ncbi:MAG: NAD-dependent epimerase/dehydratase family protein [Oscillospiraceae bacterium]